MLLLPNQKGGKKKSRNNIICLLSCSLMYPKVVACLTELRTMTEEYPKQVLQIQDIEPDVISPLIMEMVSNID